VGFIGGKEILAPTVSYQYNKHQFGIGYNLQNNGIILKYDYKFKIK